MERIGMYPGTFDPITRGHLDIISRGLKLYDKLVIGVAINEAKKPLFSLDERVAMVQREADKLIDSTTGQVEVRPFKGLLMHFAESCNAGSIIRGLRAVSDFEYEFQMASMNEQLNPDIETVFLMADVKHQAVASRLVKEIAKLGGDVSSFVTAEVKQELLEKYK